MRPGVPKINANPALPAAGLPGWCVAVLDGLLASGLLNGEIVDSLSTVELHSVARSWFQAVSAGERFDADEAVLAAQTYKRRAA